MVIIKQLKLEENNVFYLWTNELIPENVGIIWDKDYAEIVQKALSLYYSQQDNN